MYTVHTPTRVCTLSGGPFTDIRENNTSSQADLLRRRHVTERSYRVVHCLCLFVLIPTRHSQFDINKQTVVYLMSQRVWKGWENLRAWPEAHRTRAHATLQNTFCWNTLYSLEPVTYQTDTDCFSGSSTSNYKVLHMYVLSSSSCFDRLLVHGRVLK